MLLLLIVLGEKMVDCFICATVRKWGERGTNSANHFYGGRVANGRDSAVRGLKFVKSRNVSRIMIRSCQVERILDVSF